MAQTENNVYKYINTHIYTLRAIFYTRLFILVVFVNALHAIFKQISSNSLKLGECVNQTGTFMWISSFELFVYIHVSEMCTLRAQNIQQIMELATKLLKIEEYKMIRLCYKPWVIENMSLHVITFN